MVTFRTLVVVMTAAAVAPPAGAEPGGGQPDPARVGPGRGGHVAVPLVGVTGQPVFCTHNRTPARLRPDVLGGYRVAGLAPGRYQVHLELEHEQIDVLVTVPAGGEVIVPPVVARGRCQAIAVAARGVPASPASAGWSLRYGRSYRAAFGVTGSALVAPPRLRR
ncbi:MAG: hypothetical protein R3B06_04945 [Kofleriaceae bacterium]